QESNVGAGRRVADIVQHIDVVPTVLDLVKAPQPGSLRGRSLKPLLDGTGRLAPAPIYAEALYGRYHFGWSELTSLTDERYRFIKARRAELYDLQHDARERTNLADARTQDSQTLSAALDRLAAGAKLPPSDEAIADPKDTRELLERYREAMDLA